MYACIHAYIHAYIHTYIHELHFHVSNSFIAYSRTKTCPASITDIFYIFLPNVNTNIGTNKRVFLPSSVRPV